MLMKRHSLTKVEAISSPSADIVNLQWAIDEWVGGGFIPPGKPQPANLD